MNDRIRLLRLSSTLLLPLFRAGSPTCIVTRHPLPPDARLAGVEGFAHDGAPGEPPRDLGLWIWSGTFPAVPRSRTPEELPVPVVGQGPTRGGETLTLTWEALAALMYDARRASDQRVTLESVGDGTWRVRE